MVADSASWCSGIGADPEPAREFKPSIVIDLLNQKGAEYYTRGLYRQSSGLFDRCLELASRPPASRLRHALFKAHTYRAVLASLSGDDSLSRQHLNQAIVVQSENSPGESASVMKLRQMQSLMKARR